MTNERTPPTSGGVWLLAGTPVSQPYPCRCHERRYKFCSPVFCPCAGRLDLGNVGPECCAHVNTPERVTIATAAYHLRKKTGL
jgi:hypothetical protein